MRLPLLCMRVMVLTMLCCTPYANAVTLTFDDAPAGQSPYYYTDQYTILFDNMVVSDHSSSLWGPPHSAANVVVNTTRDWDGWSGFVVKTAAGQNEALVHSLSGYFGTPENAVFTLSLYRYMLDATPITTVQIGAQGEAWRDRAVTVTPSMPFTRVIIRPVTADFTLQYCLDDLTLTMVPEPAGLVALGMGAVPLAGMLARRRRRGSVSSER